MTDEQLRALVRDAIARHLGTPTPSATAGGTTVATPAWRAHPSFAKLLVTSGHEEDGPCLIEPAVPCNHCGFCQSLGH